MIAGTGNITYKNRLNPLNLHSLERCRVRGDLIKIFKWFWGINKGDIDQIFFGKQTGQNEQ